MNLIFIEEKRERERDNLNITLNIIVIRFYNIIYVYDI